VENIVVRVEGLGKRYRFTGPHQSYSTLRETISNGVRAGLRSPSRLLGRRQPDHAGTFWALKDVSFTLERGEVLGVIGRNGAGKTTLLKILSRITEPSAGWAEVEGRVGALLEVGTGFHHELTGRENIFLNGAILGMSKREILHRFDDIVAFSEIERFLDTPVKHYSSGMRMRLAFSVAAHLEPDVLIVDEVLAVGDAAFQKKCLAKMGDVAGEGRTVIYVSHSLQSVRDLCTRACLLDGGSVGFAGSPEMVIAQYRAQLERPLQVEEIANRLLFFTSFSVTFAAEAKGDESRAPELTISSVLWADSEHDAVVFNLVIESMDGVRLIHLRSDVDSVRLAPRRGLNRVAIRIPRLALAQGAYFVWGRLYSMKNGRETIADSEKHLLDVAGRNPLHSLIATAHEWEID
jgi:lipopolysaccharide transport system ATP-binding protein